MANGFFRDGDRLAAFTTPAGTGTGFIQKVAVVDGTGAADSSTAAIGSPTDAAWDGVAASATVIALLKKIALNTTPTP